MITFICLWVVLGVIFTIIFDLILEEGNKALPDLPPIRLTNVQKIRGVIFWPVVVYTLYKVWKNIDYNE